jgi:hypothetical protein
MSRIANLFFVFVVATAACSDDTQQRSAPPPTGDAITQGDTNIAGDTTTTGDSTIGPVTNCNQIPSTECFANHECPPDERCQNVGTTNNEVPCCVPGARGTLAAGEVCQTEFDCESGICITGTGSGYCSKTCNSVADCPANMQLCQFIAFSTSNDQWCFPQ